MANADHPRVIGGLQAAAGHVARCIDTDVGVAARDDEIGGYVSGPPLHVPTGVNASRYRPRVEYTVGQIANECALIENLTHDRWHLLKCGQPVAECRDGSVHAVGREPAVDLMQERDRLGDCRLGTVIKQGISHVERDDSAPHLFGMHFAHPPVEGRERDLSFVHSPAAVIAACSEAMKALEVKLAPLTVAIDADWAARASWRSVGNAVEDKVTERGSLAG